jgi:hypothetical protein
MISTHGEATLGAVTSSGAHPGQACESRTLKQVEHGRSDRAAPLLRRDPGGTLEIDIRLVDLDDQAA